MERFAPGGVGSPEFAPRWYSGSPERERGDPGLQFARGCLLLLHRFLTLSSCDLRLEPDRDHGTPLVNAVRSRATRRTALRGIRWLATWRRPPCDGRPRGAGLFFCSRRVPPQPVGIGRTGAVMAATGCRSPRGRPWRSGPTSSWRGASRFPGRGRRRRSSWATWCSSPRPCRSKARMGCSTSGSSASIARRAASAGRGRP